MGKVVLGIQRYRNAYDQTIFIAKSETMTIPTSYDEYLGAFQIEKMCPFAVLTSLNLAVHISKRSSDLNPCEIRELIQWANHLHPKSIGHK